MIGFCSTSQTSAFSVLLKVKIKASGEISGLVSITQHVNSAPQRRPCDAEVLLTLMKTKWREITERNSNKETCSHHMLSMIEETLVGLSEIIGTRHFCKTLLVHTLTAEQEETSHT